MPVAHLGLFCAHWRPQPHCVLTLPGLAVAPCKAAKCCATVRHWLAVRPAQPMARKALLCGTPKMLYFWAVAWGLLTLGRTVPKACTGLLVPLVAATTGLPLP